MHTPVFLEEAIAALNISAGGKYIDATAGEGGHTQKIAELGGNVLALDWDSKQIENLKFKILNTKVTFVQANFAEIEKVAHEHGDTVSSKTLTSLRGV